MKIVTAVALLAIASTSAHACDCSLAINKSNPQCSTLQASNVLQQSGSQSQTQSQSAQGGSSNVSNNSTNQGGNGQGGSGSASSAAMGGNSSANTAATGGNASTGSTSATAGNQGNASAQGGASGASTDSHDSTVYQAAHATAAMALAGFQVTTASCRYAEGLGVQTMPGGTSVGLTFKDHDCARFELAQFLYSRGQDKAADKLMCEVREVRSALGNDCLALIGTRTVAPVAAVPAAPADAVTHAELRAVEDRIVEKAVRK